MGRHKRSSTCPGKSQLTRVDSVHHLEVDPLSEMLLTGENPEPVLETFQNHLAAGTLEVLSPVFSGSKKPNTDNNDKCVECGAMFSSDALEQHDNIHRHKHLSLGEGLQEEKLMNATILTTDASPLLFKDFLDALDVINTNKDFLLKYINDPGSPLPFQIHNQQPNRKSRRAKSISLPICGSSSRSKDSEQMVDDWFDIKSVIESKIQNFGDFHKPSTSSSNKVDHQLLDSDQKSVGRDHNNISSDSSQIQNNVKTKNFKDLRNRIKHIIEESKNEKRRITMDAIVDKIPRGSKFSKNVRKLMNHNQFKNRNGEGNESGTTSSHHGNHLSSYSNNKRPLTGMRTTSLKEAVNRYSQLYDTCFHNEDKNNEVKYPKTESLKLKTEERPSILKTPKSFDRFLSLPNIKSYVIPSEEPSVRLSPQNSVRKSEDGTIGTSTNDDYTNSQTLSPTISDHTNEECILNDDKKQVIVKSPSETESGSDVNDDIKSEKSIGLRDNECAASNDHEIGSAIDSSTMLVEASSAFSSDTSFLDGTFELENLNLLEGMHTLFFLYFNITISHSKYIIQTHCLCACIFVCV